MPSRPAVLAWGVLLLFVLGGCAATVEPPPVPGRLVSWGEALPLPGELRQSLEQGQLEWLDGPDSYDVPVRVYGARGQKTPMILIHGLQSHSGWFAQSAAFVAGLGHPVYAMDRRGSGMSQAPRGDVKDYRAWIQEILSVAEQVRERHGRDRVYIMGHCFGAIPSTAFAISYPGLVKALLLPTPGIYTKTSIPFGAMLKIFFSPKGGMNDYLPVPLETSWFSELDDFEAFIVDDPLALRAATGDFYWQIHQARQHIQENPSRLTMPIMMAVTAEDPIADNGKNLEWLTRTDSPRIGLLRYTDARHVLEFSPERERFFADLAAWLAHVEGL